MNKKSILDQIEELQEKKTNIINELETDNLTLEREERLTDLYYDTENKILELNKLFDKLTIAIKDVNYD